MATPSPLAGVVGQRHDRSGRPGGELNGEYFEGRHGARRDALRWQAEGEPFGDTVTVVNTLPQQAVPILTQTRLQR